MLKFYYRRWIYDRVKSTLKIVLGTSVGISAIAFILFQTIPDKLISIFGSSTDENYIEFACISFRIYLMLCICNGIQIPSGIFFQAIGKSIKSAVLSLSRQILLLIPAMIAFGSLFGVVGVLYAGPFADAIAFAISVILLILEIKHLGKIKKLEHKLENANNTSDKSNKNIVITIAREYGSGGRYIGKLVADKLGIKFYDKEIIGQLAEETGLSEKYIENNEQKRNYLEALNNGYYFGLNNSDEIFLKQSELIKELASKESCVIIGRCADFILRDRKDVINVFVYSTMEDKIKRVTQFYGLDKEKAEKEIKRINKLRANHYKYYTDKEWSDNSNYDICINSDALGVEKSAELICKMIEEK